MDKNLIYELIDYAAAGNSDHNHYLERVGFTKNPSEPNHHELTIK